MRTLIFLIVKWNNLWNFCLFIFEQVNEVYYISKCNLKAANKAYSSIENEFEMTIGWDSTIEKCENSSAVPEIKFNFVLIKYVQQCENKAGIG